MIHLSLPMILVAVLAGAGVYGVVARRNAVLVLIGVELILNAANLLLVTMGSVLPDPMRAGQVLTLFVITIAAAEVGVALAVILAMYRLHGHIDLTQPASEEEHPQDATPGATRRAPKPQETPAEQETDRPAEQDALASESAP